MNTDYNSQTEELDLFKEMENDLYAALEALESRDLVTIRQCAGRVHSFAIDEWQKTNKRYGGTPVDEH